MDVQLRLTCFSVLLAVPLEVLSAGRARESPVSRFYSHPASYLDCLVGLSTLQTFRLVRVAAAGVQLVRAPLPLGLLSGNYIIVVALISNYKHGGWP